MTDPLERLENELARMRPQRVPASLIERIASDLSQPARRPCADRLLIATMSAGGMAAAVIVAVLVLESQGASGPRPPMDASTIAQQRGETPLAFARADTEWP
jgi:hypothetical protein